MKKFEYRLVELPIDIKVALSPKYSELHEKLEEKLNELGQEGWRLCGVNGCFYYFAREIQWDKIF